MPDALASVWHSLVENGIVDPDRGLFVGVILPFAAIAAVGWFLLHLLLD